MDSITSSIVKLTSERSYCTDLNMTHRPSKIISGGQTGADIGGLVGAKRLGIETGGIAPRGYRTEVGEKSKILKQFGLVEHYSPEYKDRTKENVISSDATIIVAEDAGSNGTMLTIRYCKELGKPYLVINPTSESIVMVQEFIDLVKPKILNIAGNRESKSKGIALNTAAIIEAVFK